MHEDPEEHTHEEAPLTPEGRRKQAGEQGFVPLTPVELQLSADLHRLVNSTMAEANAIMEGRYKSIAITHLETALMFFDKAIALDGTK